MWAQCYRMVFHGSNGKMESVDVNNYAESTNDKLKDHLEVRGDRRVDSSILTCMSFVGSKTQAYRQDHVNSERWLKATHKIKLPEWAEGRPRPVVEALMKRMNPLDENKRPISFEVKPVNIDEGEIHCDYISDPHLDPHLCLPRSLPRPSVQGYPPLKAQGEDP